MGLSGHPGSLLCVASFLWRVTLDLAAYARFEIAHGAWALRRLIEHAGRLPTEAIERELGIGPGPLRANIAHTIEAMFFFADCFAGRTYAEPTDFAELSKSLDGLRVLLDRAHAGVRESMLRAIAQGLPEMVPWTGTDAGAMPAAAAIAQVFDHAALHRAQCVNMLRRLGVTPVPDLDPMTFVASGSGW